MKKCPICHRHGEVPKIIENMTEVDILDVEDKCAFFMYIFQLVLNRLWMRKHPIAGRFWNSEDNFEILNLKKTLKNSLSGNASDLWQRSYR